MSDIPGDLGTKSSYLTYFMFGEEALTAGRTRHALATFETARACLDPTGEERITTAEVEQQIGICHRLIAQRMRRPMEDKVAYELQRVRHTRAAFEAFTTALRNAESRRQLAAILRDLGMVFFVEDAAETLASDIEKMSEVVLLGGLEPARGDIWCAHQLFDKSYGMLQSIVTAGEPCTEQDELELWVSQGFRARALLTLGNRWRANSLLKEADEQLRDKNLTYELNNLVWLQRTEFLPGRIKSWKRGMKLAWHVRNPKRLMQFTVQVVLPTVFV